MYPSFNEFINNQRIYNHVASVINFERNYYYRLKKIMNKHFVFVSWSGVKFIFCIYSVNRLHCIINTCKLCEIFLNSAI